MLKTSLISGPAGNLEICITPGNPKAPLAIICHPHPLYGGTMDNKVVTTLARTFAECGAATVRFNFRGIGQSEGQYDEGRGELEDLLTVVHYATSQFPQVSALWLAGFSFGGWIALKGALQLSPDRLILIAPQVAKLAEEDVSTLSCPWVLVQGEQDDVIPPDDVFKWVESLKRPPHLIRIPPAGHFFHGQLGVLREKLTAYLRSCP